MATPEASRRLPGSKAGLSPLPLQFPWLRLNQWNSERLLWHCVTRLVLVAVTQTSEFGLPTIVLKRSVNMGERVTTQGQASRDHSLFPHTKSAASQESSTSKGQRVKCNQKVTLDIVSDKCHHLSIPRRGYLQNIFLHELPAQLQ